MDNRSCGRNHGSRRDVYSKSLVNNIWSWGGFARSLLLGVVTGAVSGGLGRYSLQESFGQLLETGL
ncbi:hypothetical protein AU378_11005 [Chryseobacterium kwangjuense]|uniref:Uncharacterized protein n=2 Tax=Chryseobacterium kwangjuense TaxID=267125 RepID=A0A135WDG2_9FLAO|nr:hypothetical protein AU378_11005 [Chryseobacterium kwangjuense]